jgi:hypothetical protein
MKKIMKTKKGRPITSENKVYKGMLKTSITQNNALQSSIKYTTSIQESHKIMFYLAAE